MSEIVERLRRDKPEGLALNVEITFPSDTSFAQQAGLVVGGSFFSLLSSPAP